MLAFVSFIDLESMSMALVVWKMGLYMVALASAELHISGSMTVGVV